ncbi:MAG: hypothetical protein KME25_25890 [Symplocastrum torsivum CPER-KK1]|jgi:hypothetical protein|uniref:Uncharacterized protein n=1 Tax=Symplocastrum torsivum CPER-KK1 TaxID=450513 RepID=A0A951PR59_9CYAN|nr:hypothetical protein [Symplocastrum torsivum CPER-KK1]
MHLNLYVISNYAVQEYLNVTEGQMLTLLKIGVTEAEGGCVPLVLLTPKQPQVPQLADKIVALMEEEGVGLSDLLEGIETERQAIWQEQQQDA